MGSMATNSNPPTDQPRATKGAFVRTKTNPDDQRGAEITVAILDRVEQLHLRHPVRADYTVGRQRMIGVNQWVDAMLEWALDTWETHATEAYVAGLQANGRPPTPAELADLLDSGKPSTTTTRRPASAELT